MRSTLGLAILAVVSWSATASANTEAIVFGTDDWLPAQRTAQSKANV